MKRSTRRVVFRIASVALASSAIGCLCLAWSSLHIHFAQKLITKQPDRATRLLSMAGPQARLLPEFHKQQGRIALANNDAAAARSSFQQYLRRHRGAPEAWGYLAIAQAMAYDADATRRALDEALRLGPFEPELIGILATQGPLIARLWSDDQRARILDMLLWYAQSNPLVAVDSGERLGMLFVMCDAAATWPVEDWSFDRMQLACANKGVWQVESGTE